MNWPVTHSYIAAWASPAIALFAQEQSRFSWLQGFVIPVLFTIFGAALGFVASQIRDDRNAERAKKSFLRAVGMELDGLGNQLDGSLQEVKDSASRVASGGMGPQFAAALRTSVFTSQVGKLRDVADPLMIEVIHYYSDLGTLDQVFERVNGSSVEYNGATSATVEKDLAGRRLGSALIVLQQQITGFSSRLRELRAKLPPTEQAK